MLSKKPFIARLTAFALQRTGQESVEYTIFFAKKAQKPKIMEHIRKNTSICKAKVLT